MAVLGLTVHGEVAMCRRISRIKVGSLRVPRPGQQAGEL